jgi:putative membrane protein insertion efficiency factor
MKQLALLLIRLYQLTLSPLLGPSCRFEPSCSRYAMACIDGHGVLRGSWLAAKRILRCHPFNPGGYDPPPLPPRAPLPPHAHPHGHTDHQEDQYDDHENPGHRFAVSPSR